MAEENGVQPVLRSSAFEGQKDGGSASRDQGANTFETGSREGTPDSSKSHSLVFKPVEGPIADDSIPTLDATIPILRDDEQEPSKAFQAGKYHLILPLFKIPIRFANFGQLRRLRDLVEAKVVKS